MSLLEIRRKIDLKQARVAVIGLGYVGLPVACQFANAGFEVVGVEARPEQVEMINSGVCPIVGHEPGLSDLLSTVLAQRKFRATMSYQELRDRDVVLIAVETPVDENNVPQYEALRNAICALGPVMKIGVLVVVESTISPGTMNNLVLPLLCACSGKGVNLDFFLANCPERVMPGKLLANLRHMSRVVGGMTTETAEAAVAFYRHVVQADLDPTDCVTAELVKTTENTYRDVQIAFANEVALICEAVGGDVWKVRELVNKSPYRQMHLPGAGVGGHCIPKDPWLLVHGAPEERVPIKLIPAARAVNNSMPSHVADLILDALASAGSPVSGSRILIMGFAYLEDSDDTRKSPSGDLANRLQELGAFVVIHDPYVTEYRQDLLQAARNCDAAVVMVRHQEYLRLDLDLLRTALRKPVLIDARNVFGNSPTATRGFIYRVLGRSQSLIS